MSTRLEHALGCTTDDITDCAEMVRLSPRLAALEVSHLSRLWSEFSDTLCAQWLIVSQRTVDDFNKWLDEEIG